MFKLEVYSTGLKKDSQASTRGRTTLMMECALIEKAAFLLSACFSSVQVHADRHNQKSAIALLRLTICRPTSSSLQTYLTLSIAFSDFKR